MRLEDFVEERDLVILDLETTGTSVQKDRVVQFAAVKVFADGRDRVTLESLINPEMKIPRGASEVHKITDDMVRTAPKFRDYAPGIADFLDGGAGSNLDVGRHFFGNQTGEAWFSEFGIYIKKQMINMRFLSFFGGRNNYLLIFFYFYLANKSIPSVTL